MYLVPTLLAVAVSCPFHGGVEATRFEIPIENDTDDDNTKTFQSQLPAGSHASTEVNVVVSGRVYSPYNILGQNLLDSTPIVIAEKTREDENLSNCAVFNSRNGRHENRGGRVRTCTSGAANPDQNGE